MKSIFKVSISLMSAMFIVGCAGNSGAKPTVQGEKVKNLYMTTNKVGYASGSRIARNIKNECHLDTEFIVSLKESAKEKGINFQIVDSVPTGGAELKLEITDAISAGNAFIGHRKFVSIKGNMRFNGKESSFEAARRTGGGFLGGFKSSCAVLNRAVSALADDTIEWVGNPINNDELGDVELLPMHQ